MIQSGDRCSFTRALLVMEALVVVWALIAGELRAADAAQPTAMLRPAPDLRMPHAVDCNTPSHWDKDLFYVFNSTGHPFRSFGEDLFHLGKPEKIEFDNRVNGGRWIEATWRVDDGTLYGWYHNEPARLCPGTNLTAPKIGALRSTDNGLRWKDLGVILEARRDTLRCDAQNGYFAGGHGDFCVMLDEGQEYLYVFYGNYAGGVGEQGVAVARMAWRDRDAPVGKVRKWYDGGFREPGLGGRRTPTFAAMTAWERADCDAFWGPSVHWNTHLKQYVMLLNRAKGKGWGQEGIYVSFSRDLAAPMAWSKPRKILDGGKWYPVVVGLGDGMRGTDKLAGRVARFFMGQQSKHEIVFSDSNTQHADDAPAHGRPFFMPAQERARIRQLIAAQEWAKADYARIQQAARKGDGYLAAFLHALDGDPAYVPIARKWLLGKFGANAGTTKRARGALDNPGFFKAGVPHLSDVFYDTDFSPYVAFDWVHKGLEPAARQEIQAGISAFMHFKMRCMDRWTQTPNLVFKPTSIVALAGLAIQEQELIDWGFHRKPESRIGGYYPVLNSLLKDGGPWHEAPIYPIGHTVLYCMGMVSRYRALYDGKDWWSAKAPNGGSPKGLMDYYIDSAYPIERTGYGPGQIRVATYGDGATNAKHDLFLVNPAGAALDITKALIAAYNASGDPRLAPFVAMVPDYKPTLIDRRPLPEKVEFPSAPSRGWPDFGLAILRAEESPAYWTSDAPVVFALMTQGYGHDHADKFAITFHGAGRLLYPDYNAVQYENPDTGWTRNTIAHNTLMVDEGDTRPAQPSDVRHAFTPEVKYLATSASGVFEKVAQTRALLLTREYLLDLFQASSPTPRTFDYLLHSFGMPRPAHPELFQPSSALDRRFWLVSDRRAMATDKPWALDFIIKEEPGSRKGKFGPEWYEHTAAVRVTMAAEPKTLVSHGISGIALGRQMKRTFDPLGMLIVRRDGVRQTIFVATHEPYANAAKPGIRTVTKLAESGNAALVRVDAADFTDYAAVAFGPQQGAPEHVLAATGDPKTRVAFRDYGYLRVRNDGTVVARGGWTGLRLPATKGALILNGKPVPTAMEAGRLVYGNIPPVDTPAPRHEVECPLPIETAPAVVRLAPAGRRTVTFTVKNVLKTSVSGSFALDLPAGVSAEPAVPRFAPLTPGQTARVPVTLVAEPGVKGERVIAPYRVSYRAGDAAPVTTAALPATLAIGPVLHFIYQHPKTNVYQIDAPLYTIQHDMFHGLCRYLADDADIVRLDGAPLFTFRSEKKEMLHAGTSHAFTWPSEAPARLTAHVYDRCRYHVRFGADRITVRMDAGWAQFDPAYFTVPGKWVSLQGPPAWARIIAVDGTGKEVEAKPGTKLRIAAAELAFPGARWNLAFTFTPPQPVAFNGTEMQFPIGSLNGDAWSVGFCKPGGLDAWRKGR